MLLHEASHALMARRYGYPVSSITLHFLGGMTAVEGEARSPKHEPLIAVVGPLTSLAVGRRGSGAADRDARRAAARWRSGAWPAPTCSSALINLVPGLPLDGGRVLKAVVWWLSGNAHRGTLAAGWGGRVAAVLALSYPVVLRDGVGRASPTSSTSCSPS